MIHPQIPCFRWNFKKCRVLCCNSYLDRVSDQLVGGLPRTLPLITLLAKYYGLHRLAGAVELLINLKDPTLAGRLLGDFIDRHLQDEPSPLVKEEATRLLKLVREIDEEADPRKRSVE